MCGVWMAYVNTWSRHVDLCACVWLYTFRKFMYMCGVWKAYVHTWSRCVDLRTCVAYWYIVVYMWCGVYVVWYVCSVYVWCVCGAHIVCVCVVCVVCM